MEKLKPDTGRVLISDPFLRDPNFSRTVVLLTEHSPEGTIGFVLNHKLDLHLSRVLKDKKLPKTPVLQGGPVELNTLHFIHSLGQIIPDSSQIAPGVWWGGNFEHALSLIRRNEALIEHFHFFVGYSGWGEGQLEDELKEEAWLVADIRANQIFPQVSDGIWKDLMTGLGGQYKILSNSPIDPQLN